MNRPHADTVIITFILFPLRVLLKIIVCIMTLAQLGMDVTSIIATPSAAGLAIGLAVKDSMSNIASGAQIIFTPSFPGGGLFSREGGAEAPWNGLRSCLLRYAPTITGRLSSPTQS